MKKRILGFALCLAMLIGIIAALPVYTSAAEVWDGTASEAFEGDGSKNAPFLIASGKNLRYLQEQVLLGNNFNGKYLTMTNDIDLGGKEWTPIGGRGTQTPFSGVFDGKGFTVKGLSITTNTQYSGLFGAIAPTSLFDVVIANLTVEGNIVLDNDDVFAANPNIGGITGWTESSSEDYRVVITNCTSNVNITIDKLTTGNFEPYVGGITGRGQRTDIIACVNNGDIVTKLGGDAKVLRVGGLIGASYMTTIVNSVNNGDITAVQNSTDKRLDYIGGFIGVSATSTNSVITTIKNSINNGDVSAENMQPKRVRVGGFIGAHYLNFTTIENCYNTGNIHAKVTDVTGIDPIEYAYVGGITGHFDKEGSGINSIIIKESYNDGALSYVGGMGDRVGGIVGEGVTYPENPAPSKIIDCKTTSGKIAGTANEGLVVTSTANITLTEFNTLINPIDIAIATDVTYDFSDAIKYLDKPAETTTVFQETTKKPETTKAPTTTAASTTATTTTPAETQAPKKSSCGSSSTSFMVALIALSGACVFVFTKKKF